MPSIHVPEVLIAKPDFLAGGSWKISGMTQFTILFGKNGSGKSLLLRAIRDADRADCHYVIPERTGEIDYQPQRIQAQSNPEGRADQSAGNFNNEYRRNTLVRIYSYLAVRGNYRGPTPPADPAEIEAFINNLIPDFSVKLSGTGNQPYDFVREGNQASNNSAGQFSSGEAQLLTMSLDILTVAAMWEIESKPRRIMLVDEPDAHIHPDLQARFADFIVQAANRYGLQIILSTHSTSFLAAMGQFGGDQTGIVYLDKFKTEFSVQPFTAVSQELAAILGGHVLMGPLFGAPLLLVEGDDDFRIWSQVPRHNQISLSVIPAGGDAILKFQKSLEQIFGSLRNDNLIPAGYALRDGDKPMPVENEHNPQRHIKFIQLNCYETENLYLTDEVLELLGINWERATQMILSAANQYGEKAAFLSTVGNWDRQRSDIKDVIKQIELILDAKRVHWTIRVAKAMGSSRPGGQIGNFLGEQLIAALWGPPPPIVQALDG